MSNVTVENHKPAPATPPAKSQTKSGKVGKAAKENRAGKGTKKASKSPATKPNKASIKPASENKKAEVIAMMRRPKGATLAEIAAATGWQRHTVRGFVSILGKKGGVQIDSSKNASAERTYKIGK